MTALPRLALAPIFLALACGGSKSEPNTPEPVETEEAPDPSWNPDPKPRMAEEEPMDEPEEDAEDKPAPGAEPQWPENATVEQAIAAVPQGAERLNIDHATLAKPLQKPELYEPCKAGNKHFTMKIAIWNGRAVGVDVVTKDQKLADCLKDQIRQIEWDDKVPSLNTIEYGF